MQVLPRIGLMICTDRLLFPTEHEVEGSSLEGVLREDMNTLVVAKDSCEQFLLMNIKEDYMRFKEGGLHLEREQTRVNTFVSRLNA